MVKNKRLTCCLKIETENRSYNAKSACEEANTRQQLNCCDILRSRPSTWMSPVMRLTDKTCVHLRGLLGFPGDREPHEKHSSFSASCHCLRLCLYISIPRSSLPLPSVHLNCRRASSSWQDKIECAHQHRLPSSRVPLFDQLISESNQA